MQAAEIPLTPDNQQFSIGINGASYSFKAIWRDDAGWVIDLMDGNGAGIIYGIPLVTGVNLMAQYNYLSLGFGLAVVCDDPLQDKPTKTGLGLTSHLYAITE
ncbi:hypothetical protein BTJ39_22235 [Izhakiella australiensis]|uniref:Cyanophage baseplate Pam3 plug gp18 domain-containing protein n=1 Tax=Izhakiella australiensis TaxID=1926881 RepID=A0A1S8Y9T7_9GAMM|nr:hypothetical protein [Izhakiella australiensis]OON35597.1 hypothetical protein BTJ39_22235 [Izhakiella australiensis]